MINLYPRWVARMVGGQVQPASLQLRAMLVRDTFDFDPDDEFVSAVSQNEIQATGYSRLALPTPLVVSVDTLQTPAVVSLNVQAPPATLSWEAVGAGEEVDGLVVYEGTGSSVDDVSNRLVAYWAQASSQGTFPFTTDGGDIEMTLPSQGILRFQVS